jgi:ADP-ribosylglycohydrolase
MVASLPRNTSTEKAAKILGCGWDVSAIDTVPFALWCAINYLDNFEEALWQTISVGGDADTTGAMVGGIIASYGGQACIPQSWKEHCEPLPEWALGDGDDS